MSSLIVLCASHINGEKRLSNFQKMLKSIAGQKVKVPLFVSISAISDEIRIEIEKITKMYPSFTFFIQDKKLTQFEHYTFLANTALSYDPELTWCIFTDDDDISHSSRSKVFLEHIDSITDNTDVVTDTTVYTKYTDVNNVVFSEFFKPIKTEYIIHACKLCCLQEFCKKASSKILAMAGCDMIFSVWLTSGKTKTFHNKTWLYEYTIRPGANRSIAATEDLKTVDLSCFNNE